MGPLEVVAAAEPVVVVADAVDDDDRFEEVNVRSRQSVPEEETTEASSPEPPVSSRRGSSRKSGRTDERIGDSQRDVDQRDGLVASRQVYSHEEKPCGSVNYVTSPTADADQNLGKLDEARGAPSSLKKPWRSESVDQPSTAVSDPGDQRQPNKDTPPPRPAQHQTPTSQHKTYPKQQQPKPRPKSQSKTEEGAEEGVAYDVSLSKMASETHRFLSEGVAAAAAAAVDAVLTHTTSAAAAAAASSPAGKESIGSGSQGRDAGGATSGSTGKKVKPGYGVYQPPKRRGESVDEKTGS